MQTAEKQIFTQNENNYVLRAQAVLYVIELFNSAVFLDDHIPILRLFVWIWIIREEKKELRFAGLEKQRYISKW